MRKLVNVQHLRAVAALIVIISHLAQNTNEMNAQHGVPTRFPQMYGTFGVDIFFVISGFIMFYTSSHSFGKPGAVAEFVKRRLIRIVPIYWLLTLAQAAILFASRLDEPSRQIQAGELIKSFLFIPYVAEAGKFRPILGVGWSLNFEMLFYVIFAASIFFPRKIGIALILSALVVCVTAGQMLDPSGALAAWTMPVMLEFMAGVLIAMAYKRGWLTQIASIPALLPVLVLVALQELLFQSPNVPNQELTWRPEYWACSIAIMLSALLFKQDQETNIFSRVMTAIGNSSYSLYLTHVLVLQCAGVAIKILGGNIFNQQIYLGAMFVIILAVGWFFHILVEAPVTRFLSRRFTRRPPPVGMNDTVAEPLGDQR